LLASGAAVRGAALRCAGFVCRFHASRRRRRRSLTRSLSANNMTMTCRLFYYARPPTYVAAFHLASLKLMLDSHRPPDPTRRSCLCRGRRCKLSRPDRPTNAFSIGVCRAAQALPMRPPDALRHRTHLSGGRADSVHAHSRVSRAV